MTRTQLIYIDTNVFGYLLLPHPQSNNPLVHQAKNFISDIVDRKYTGITSTLTEMEYRGVAKRIISQVNNNQISLNDEQIAMNDLTRFIQKMGIGLVDADQIASNIFGTPRIFSAAGDTVKMSIPFFNSNRKLWKMIKSIDSLTITIAIRIGANLIATFDEGFKGLRNQHITPLIIQDVYPP